MIIMLITGTNCCCFLKRLQFVIGFFSFLVLLCCEGATAACRASLVPTHATFGLITFVMAAATAVTGLTEKALFELKYVFILLS